MQTTREINALFTLIDDPDEEVYSTVSEKLIAYGKGIIPNLEHLWETTLNPQTRTLRQISVDNAAEADRVFSMLMGDEVPPRREFIEKNAKYAKVDV